MTVRANENSQKRRVNKTLTFPMPIGLSPVEKHARVASFNNSESQLEITKASNQQDLDLSDDKEI
jgi:hypothetical protein